jgi:hypothetical protein
MSGAAERLRTRLRVFTDQSDGGLHLDRPEDWDPFLEAVERHVAEERHNLLMKGAEIGYTYGALGRDFANVLPELRRIADAEADPEDAWRGTADEWRHDR